MWHVTCNIWHMTWDMWHMVHCGVRRHSWTTKPFMQLNQKSWPKSFTRTISVPFWELVHIFEHFFFFNYRSHANMFYFGGRGYLKKIVIEFDFEVALNQINWRYTSVRKKKNYWLQSLTFEDMHQGPIGRPPILVICTSSPFESI